MGLWAGVLGGCLPGSADWIEPTPVGGSPTDVSEPDAGSTPGQPTVDGGSLSGEDSGTQPSPVDGGATDGGSAPVAGNTYYVSPLGQDSGPGTQASPFKTIAKAVLVARAGDVIRVAPGTYREKLQITTSGKPDAPITLLGDSADPAQYPVLDGGDPNYANTSTDVPLISMRRASFWVFERLRLVNASATSVALDASGYVVLRRLRVEFHQHGVRLFNKSHHILMERCELSQTFPAGSTWSQLKGSKWEGGALTSFGGAGMNVIRYNFVHDVFNGVYLGNDSGGRPQAFYDANVWIYRNRFENVIDDPFEPESQSFNNHFFHNRLVDTHRMVSLAPTYLGPIYVYGNVMTVSRQVTGENRVTSAFKVELDSTYPAQGVYLFNNSVDVSAAGLNGKAIDLLADTVKGLFHWNNAYRTELVSIGSATLVGSEFDYDLSQQSLGFPEPHGAGGVEPGFVDPVHGDLRLLPGAAAAGKARAVSLPSGFTTSGVVPAGAAVGAYELSEVDYRAFPEPVYVVPPGGEDPSFGAQQYPWPADVRGGVNPPSG